MVTVNEHTTTPPNWPLDLTYWACAIIYSIILLRMLSELDPMETIDFGGERERMLILMIVLWFLLQDVYTSSKGSVCILMSYYSSKNARILLDRI